MNALQRFMARLFGLAAPGDKAVAAVARPVDNRTMPHLLPMEAILAEAHDKRRLERLLRERGMSRAAAGKVVHDYFQGGAR